MQNNEDTIIDTIATQYNKSKLLKNQLDSHHYICYEIY